MVFQIDLKRQPEVADLISAMSMGDKVKFITSLKSSNGELAEFTLEHADECTPEEKARYESDDDEGESEEEAEVDGDEQRRHAKMPAPGGSPNTPGGSRDQDRMSAALTAQI